MKYNRLRKLYLEIRNPRVSNSQVFELKLTKFHHHALFVGALVGVCSFYLQMQNTGIRSQTFTKNYALIEAKFGEEHRQALGADQKINKYGYPDIGNNLYSELLPYRDWVKVNNA